MEKNGGVMLTENHPSTAALLHWYALCGADEAVGDEAQIWFDRAPPPPSPKPVVAAMVKPAGGGQKPASPNLFPPQNPVPADNGIAAAMVRAREVAKGCADLESLKKAMQDFDGLAIRETATQLVFADGVPGSRLMLVGEAPGKDEDEQGKPFVGVSGQLLDRMLAAIGRDRTNSYIGNIVPWRPPGNRKPSQDEITLCLPFIERHIELAKPAVILLLGDTAAKAILKTTEGITRSRGRWHDYVTPFDRQSFPVIASFHPEFLLRNPVGKRESWRDLIQIRARLEGLLG